MEQITATGVAITLIHLFSYEKYVVREEQTMMRDSWRDSPGHIACMPGMTEFHRTKYHPAYQRSNDPRAVTCPACRRSHEYNRAMEKLNAATKK